jgi:hypothetical protein
MPAFFCVVLSCIGSSLATGRFPVQGILPAVCMSHNFQANSKWEQARWPNPSREGKIRTSLLTNFLTYRLLIKVINELQKQRPTA